MDCLVATVAVQHGQVPAQACYYKPCRTGIWDFCMLMDVACMHVHVSKSDGGFCVYAYSGAGQCEQAEFQVRVSKSLGGYVLS